ncbi:hypothetical protein [Phenylobacterium deserti]|uniref:hypothetical protein n=1 Tax=Phenylobacterium deserti TaxID=1914756 RepID=UPI0014027354|nr:hypothetical protein [Phenylobacterium deserti]
MFRIAFALLTALAVAAPAEAQLMRRAPQGPPEPPPNLSPAEAEIWPFPLPDPNSWWEEKRLKVPEAADPLGNRRMRRGERLIPVDNGVDPATYRLWGLMPLQWQVVRGDEMIIEVWVRPSDGVRQSVVRVVVRGSDAFVQGRAGLACCEAGIARRVGFDVPLPAGSAQRFSALRNHAMWNAPREVHAIEPGGDSAEGLCVNGTAYDLTLLVAGRSRSLHRACDDREIGEAADVLEPVLQAAQGHEPRFDVLFARGVDFSADRRAYQQLIAEGGRLNADRNARPQPPGFEPMPQPETSISPGSAPSNP